MNRVHIHHPAFEAGPLDRELGRFRLRDAISWKRCEIELR